MTGVGVGGPGIICRKHVNLWCAKVSGFFEFQMRVPDSPVTPRTENNKKKIGDKREKERFSKKIALGNTR